MKQLLRFVIIAFSIFFVANVMAAPRGPMLAKPQFSLPGYFGSINNNSLRYVIECVAAMGGYCANNPMPANGYIQMAPDPGARHMRFHLMVIDKEHMGRYAGSFLVHWDQQRDGNWAFTIHKNYGPLEAVQLKAFNAIVLQERR